MRKLLIAGLIAFGAFMPGASAEARQGPPVTGAVAQRVAADRLIVPFRSVGPVSLGMGTSTVHRVLGTPRDRRGVPAQWFYLRRGLVVGFDTLGKVDAITVINGRGGYETASGIGISATTAAVRRAYPRARRMRSSYSLERRHGDTVRSIYFFAPAGRVTRLGVSLEDYPPPQH